MARFPADPPRLILSIGECMVEFARLDSGLWQQGFAGDTLNVAWALRALMPSACRVSYYTHIGTDGLSARLVQFLDRAGIETGLIRRNPDRTVGLYTIETDASGERHFDYWRSMSAARQLAANPDVLRRALDGVDLVYLSGITAAILDETSRRSLLSVLSERHAHGVRLAFDPNYRPRLWASVPEMRDFVQAVAPIVDVCLPTFEDEVLGFGDAAPAETVARYLDWGCAEVIVKNGVAPVLAGHGDLRFEQPNEHLVTPVDTTGAGDSFNGGYLAARTRGEEIPVAIRQAQAVSARVVQTRGAMVDMTALAELIGSTPVRAQTNGPA